MQSFKTIVQNSIVIKAFASVSVLFVNEAS